MSLRCTECPQTFENSTARSRHHWCQHGVIPPITVDGKEYRVKRMDGKVMCPVEQCGRSYTSRDAFTKHVRAHHETVRVSSKPSPPLSFTRTATFASVQRSFMPLSQSGFPEDVARRLRIPRLPILSQRAGRSHLTSQRTVRNLSTSAGWILTISFSTDTTTTKGQESAPARSRDTSRPESPIHRPDSGVQPVQGEDVGNDKGELLNLLGFGC